MPAASRGSPSQAISSGDGRAPITTAIRLAIPGSALGVPLLVLAVPGGEDYLPHIGDPVCFREEEG